MTRSGIYCLVLIAALGFGCSKGEQAETAADDHDHAGADHDHDHDHADDTQSAGGAGGGTAAALDEGHVAHAGLAYAVPEGWLAETPSSSMRKAQYSLPSGEPDVTGEVTLFHFGPGGGGGVEANLRRWAGQFQQPDGSDPMKKAETDQMQVGDLRVSTIEVDGRYVSAMPGAPAYNEADWRLFGAVVEGPGGPWFFKGVGPKAVIEQHRDGFLAMIRSAKPVS